MVDKPSEEADYKEEEEEEPLKSKAETCYDFNKNKRPQTCATCQSTCNSEQYCSSTQLNFYLCKTCFMEGKYPSNQNSGQFVLERFDIEAEDAWDEEEEELLKEGLGMFSDDWEKVSNHVGTRTHDECVLQYLQLPINDPFHDAEIEKLGLLQYDSVQHRENPIMAAVAFLASAVEPKVAAAAGDIHAFDIIPISPDIKEETAEEEEEEEKLEEELKPVRSEKEEADLCELTNIFFRHKLAQYKQQTTNYQELETIVEEQKNQLERERRQLEQDQGSLKRKVLLIRQEMAKRISKANAIASIITPAQLQQQLAGANPAMFLNGNQRHHQHQQHQSPQALQQLQLQQQQYQLQMQMQMQQQARPNGPGYNNMMSL